MEEVTYWVVEFTGIDGKRHELPNKFSAETNAAQWAADMPAWQAPTVRQMWDYR